MQKATKNFVGKYDFAAFMAAGSPVKTTVRTISELSLSMSENTITMDITADGFLYNMARIIAGTLVYCGNNKIEPDNIPMIINSRKRTLAGITAPPEGLTLKEVFY